MLYPIGIQTFSEIRQGGYVYVDKTADIYKLASTGKYYFLSRPRRFGKSLLVSTMEAYFKGRKELFKDLAIERLEKDWTEYPVLHFDFSGGSFISLNDLTEKIDGFLCAWEKIYGKENDYESMPERFSAVIDAAHAKTGEKVVVLIDEYEKPIIDNIDSTELMDQFRRTLKASTASSKAKTNISASLFSPESPNWAR